MMLASSVAGNADGHDELRNAGDGDCMAVAMDCEVMHADSDFMHQGSLLEVDIASDNGHNIEDEYALDFTISAPPAHATSVSDVDAIPQNPAFPLLFGNQVCYQMSECIPEGVKAMRTCTEESDPPKPFSVPATDGGLIVGTIIKPELGLQLKPFWRGMLGRLRLLAGRQLHQAPRALGQTRSTARWTSACPRLPRPCAHASMSSLNQALLCQHRLRHSARLGLFL
eukprot:UN0976